MFYLDRSNTSTKLVVARSSHVSFLVIFYFRLTAKNLLVKSYLSIFPVGVIFPTDDFFLAHKVL